MTETLRFVAEHGYLLLLVFVFAEQIGLPIPSIPVLLAGGALARVGQIDFATAMGVCILAALLSDVIWFEFGRVKGAVVMRLLCKISLEPDSCVRQTETFFSRWGVRGLLVAKFVPGLNTAAPPMAGVFKMGRIRFLLFDLIGAIIWAGSFLGLGWVFGNQIDRVVEVVSSFGSWFGAILVLALAGWIGLKYRQRKRFLRDLRTARIAPDELRERIERGHELAIVDLRHRYDFESEPATIPGSIHIPVEEFNERSSEIPLDKEIILFCT